MQSVLSMSRRVLPVVAAATVLGAALLLSVRPAAAQSVLGRVLDQDSGAPLQGVFLTLTDSLGHRATGTLSREDGTFVLRARHPGTYLLRLELIGYSAMAETVRVDADDADPRVFRMPTQAVELEGLVATSERGACTVRPSEGDALARLWDTARQGLRLAEWSAEAGWLRASGYTYQRVLQLTDSEVLTDQVRRRPSVEPAAFTAVDPVEARDRGFVVAEEDGSILYHGADAALLLSDEFLDTH
ncbi:MAG TPA: carboxypeptidase regulatory-like domain-containing protein, partial [Longimicrobiales bacterium]|nr:carboxypeptidase regulatory-like domain-containing protein [Longimicrobiales bacterium]